MGVDAAKFLEARGTAKSVGVRLVYVMLSETGKPVLPVLAGSFLAAVISRRLTKQSQEKPNVATGKTLSAD